MNDTTTTTIERSLLIAATESLLHAGVLNRDIMSAMPIDAALKMPVDILNRIMHPRYQGLFDAMPADIQAEALVRFEADPDIIEAKRIDAASR